MTAWTSTTYATARRATGSCRRLDSTALQGGPSAIDPIILGIRVHQPLLIFANLSSIAFALWLFRREGVRLRSILIVLLAVQWIGSLFGAKLFSLVVDGWGDSLWQAIVRGGWRYPGAVIGMLVVGYALRRWLPRGLTLGRFFDVLAPSFAVANAIGHVACVLSGCCHGTVCTLPWAWVYPRQSIAWFNTVMSGDILLTSPVSAPVHPVPLYTFLLDVAVGVLCYRMLGTRRYDGQVMLVFLALHAPLRTLLEFLRFDYDPRRQVILVVGVVAWMILYLRRAQRLPVAAA